MEHERSAERLFLCWNEREWVSKTKRPLQSPAKIDLTLNIKANHTKTLLEVNLDDIRKNTSPISQKTEVHFKDIWPQTWPYQEFLTTIHWVIVYFIITFCLTFDGGFLRIREISRSWGILAYWDQKYFTKMENSDVLGYTEKKNLHVLIAKKFSLVTK